MKIKKITFENFRNLQKGELVADSGINVIYGDNAQGKTNLIEAMWLFSGAKSFRGAKEASLVRTDADFARLEMDFFADEREQTASLVIGGGRTATLNGVKLRSASELAGNFRAVVFSPTHLSLVKDGPSERRRFLDMAIFQIWPKYASLYHEYAHCVQQRNTLLKDVRFNSQLLDMIEVYEDEIAKKGAKIIAYRKRYVELIKKHAEEIYGGISGGKEALEMRYESVEGGEEASTLLNALKESRATDMQTGTTSVGPHRDDLDFTVSGLSARQFASQGQQRSTVLAVKLAEAAVLKEVGGEQPVALLDDVMSELDEFRQDYILNHIRDWQVFLTCCDRNSVGLMKQGAVFRMEKGLLVKEG